MSSLNNKQGTDPPLVVLVHGILMTGLELSLLARRLRRQGFAPQRFRYRSRAAGPDQQAGRLQDWLQARAPAQVHFVGHSLGGILLLHLFDRFPDQPPGRLVLLGSPVAGSQVARVLAAHPHTRWLLGRGGEQGLLGGAPKWRGGRDLGVIAGSQNVGVGRLVTRLPSPNDGTVAVAETQLAGAKESLVLPVSHMGMVAAPSVADAVGRFLAQGSFRRP